MTDGCERKLGEMPELTVVLPDHVSRDEALLRLAMKLYEARKLSLGKAAELARYSVRAFVEILNKHGISVFRCSPEALDKDLQHALHPHRGKHGLHRPRADREAGVAAAVRVRGVDASGGTG
ncbi:MAG: UPF0175 family protein [Bacillota bacterium]